MNTDDPPLTPAQIKELFSEWTKDYAAAKERDSKTALRDILSGKAIESSQPTTDEQRDREGGIER